MMRSIKDRPAFIALVLASVLIVTLCFAFEPRWETNDDVAMSMIAHGYGFAAYGSPNIVNSNVLWGYLVRAIPTVNGVLGYSLATLTVLLVAGWATLYFLLRLGAGYLLGSLAVVLFIVRPILFPQFTINAGLLTVAAIIGWQVYARWGGVGSLVAACLLAFFGYLVRDIEFLFMLGVALPLLPWRALRERRQMQVAVLLLGVAIASVSVFDRWPYNGSEWQYFKDERVPLRRLVDFSGGLHLKQHPEILARHGYSQNDIDLLANFFFADPQIDDPKSLNVMLAELGPAPLQDGSVQSGFASLKVLAGPVLLPLILPALLLLVLIPKRSVALTWIFCLAALFATGFMGRSSQLRIYLPLMGLLLIAPLMVGKCKEGIRQWLAALTLLIACAGNAYVLMPQTLASTQWIHQIQKDIRGLPAELITIWGEDFPREHAFPVLANNPNTRDIKLYGFTSYVHAPFSISAAEEKAGRGFVRRLQTEEGVPIIAQQRKLGLLDTYCKEHLNGQLHRAAMYQTPSLQVWRVRCEVANMPHPSTAPQTRFIRTAPG